MYGYNKRFVTLSNKTFRWRLSNKSLFKNRYLSFIAFICKLGHKCEVECNSQLILAFRQ